MDAGVVALALLISLITGHSAVSRLPSPHWAPTSPNVSRRGSSRDGRSIARVASLCPRVLKLQSPWFCSPSLEPLSGASKRCALSTRLSRDQVVVAGYQLPIQQYPRTVPRQHLTGMYWIDCQRNPHCRRRHDNSLPASNGGGAGLHD